MINLKKLSLSALITTTFFAIPFAYGMDPNGEEIEKQYTKLPFTSIKVGPSTGAAVLVSVEEQAGSGNFRLTSSDEAKQAIDTLISAYSNLPEDQEKTKLPFIKLKKNNDGEIIFKEKENTGAGFRYLKSDEINEKLQTMLEAYNNACLKEESRIIEEQARQQQETLKIQKAKEEYERNYWEKLEQEQNEQAKAELERQLGATAQAEYEKNYWENQKKQQEAEKQNLIFGRTPDHVAHNINKEVERGLGGVNDLLKGKSWGHGRKKDKGGSKHLLKNEVL